MRVRYVLPLLLTSACPGRLVLLPVDGVAGEGKGDVAEGEGEGEGDVDGGDGEGEGREGEPAEGEGEDGEGEAAEGEGEVHVVVDPCEGVLRDFVNPDLSEGAQEWELTDAFTEIDAAGDAVARFLRPALCGGRPSIAQTVEVPGFCGDRAPALTLISTSRSGEVGRVGPGVADEVGAVLPLSFADDSWIAFGPFAHCLGDSQLGRPVRFAFSGAVFPTGARSCSDDPVTDVVLRAAHLSLAVCPRPGEARPFSAWHQFDGDNNSTVDDGTLLLRTEGACDTGLFFGPASGAVSVPAAFSRPALVVRGHKAASHPRSFSVRVDGHVIDSVDAFDDLVVCLPTSMRGNVVSLALRLDAGGGSCNQPAPQLAVIEAIDVVDELTCTGAVPSPSHWAGLPIVNEDDDGIIVGATSCPNGFEVSTFVQAPPAGTRAALRVRYAADSDVDVYLRTLGTDFLPSTDGAVVEVDRCLEPRAAGQVLPVVFMPRMDFLNDGGAGDECASAEARFESVEVVESEDCAPLF